VTSVELVPKLVGGDTERRRSSRMARSRSVEC